MRVILKISALLLMCMLIYKCQKTEYVAEFEDDDPDEIGWIGEDLTGEELDTRASTFKIHQVVATDSLPEFQVTNPAKKQKFGKRQIVSTTAKTRFWIRGIGFRVRTDSSNVKCYIKTVEQAGIEIVSWDSNQVVVDFPILTSQLLIDNTFSIQFKIFRKNDNPLKANISRSRSRGCISSVKAGVSISNEPFCRPASDSIELYRKNVLNLNTFQNKNGYMSDVTVNGWEKYVTEVGDILYTESDYQGKVHCAIVIGFHQYNSYTRYVTLFMVQQAYCGLIYSPERYKVEWAKFTVYTPSGQTVERFNKITPVEDHFSKHLVFERFKK